MHPRGMRMTVDSVEMYSTDGEFLHVIDSVNDSTDVSIADDFNSDNFTYDFNKETTFTITGAKISKYGCRMLVLGWTHEQCRLYNKLIHTNKSRVKRKLWKRIERLSR